MNYSFNWSAVSGGAPYVTISPISIAFNSVSIEKLKNPEKVIIGFDEDNCVIGVKAYAGEPAIKPYTFASRVKNGWVRIGCRDFVKYLQALKTLTQVFNCKQTTTSLMCLCFETAFFNPPPNTSYQTIGENQNH